MTSSRFWPACKGTAHQALFKKQMRGGADSPYENKPYPEVVNLPFNYSALGGEFNYNRNVTAEGSESCYWALIQGSTVILQSESDTLLLPHSPLPSWLAEDLLPVVVGTWRDKPLLAATVRRNVELQPPFVANDFNAGSDAVDIVTLSVAGMAKQILHWERSSRHCSCCGASVEPLAGQQWGKRCTSCGSQHFPHIHPCAIILVKRGKELLLARKAEWVTGRYGLVAGFVDFGESLEECAIREVREETGIEINNVRYVGSQCWPFPSQIMAGFVAEYAGGDINIDTAELEDARWFSPDELPLLPGRRSIARWIIDNFK